MLEFGFSEGLAYRHNFQQDIQNRHENAMLDMQARARAEAKAKLTADLFNQGKAFDTYNQKRLKDFSEKQITEIGRYIDENGGMDQIMLSGQKLAQLNNMSKQLIDNPIILESTMAKDAKDRMTKWAQENPESVNSPAYQNQLNAYEAYAKSDNGVHAPFMFVPPKPWGKLNDQFMKYGNGIKNFEKVPLDPATNGLGAWETVPNPKTLEAVARTAYFENKDEIDYLSRQAGVTPQEFVKAGLQPFINREHQKGDWDALLKLQEMQNTAPGVSPYQRSIVDPFVKKDGLGVSELPPEMVEKMFGKSTEVATIYGKGPSDKINWKGREVTWNGRMRRESYQGQVQPVAEGTITISREEAIDMDIVKSLNFLNESGTNDVEDQWKEFATVRETPTGELVVDIQVVKPFDPMNETYKLIVDGPVPDKQQTPPGTLTQPFELYQAKENPNYAKGSDGRIYKYTGTGDIKDPANWKPK